MSSSKPKSDDKSSDSSSDDSGKGIKDKKTNTSEDKKSSDDKSDKRSETDSTLKLIEHIREANDFYVQRVLDSSTKTFKIIASNKKSDDSVDIDYSVTRYQKEPQQHRNGSTVRIPAMFWLNKFESNYLEDLITSRNLFGGSKAMVKKQWGSHIFLNSTAHMQTLNCYLTIKHEYCAQKASEINCIFPVLKNFTKPEDRPTLLLGMLFSCKTDVKGDRTFAKSLDQKDNSDGVWDITEDFIDATSQSINYSSEKFATETRKYAFYVCEDTRLIVTDDRGSNGQNLTRSLFLQGSLVILETVKGYELKVGPEFYTRQKKKSSSTIGSEYGSTESINDSETEMVPCLCRWKNLGSKTQGFVDKKWFNGVIPEEERDSIIKSETKENKETKEESNNESKESSVETNDSSDSKEIKELIESVDPTSSTKLNEQRRVVIFLGATESQYNTVCWRLELDSKTKENILRPPDGARLIDVMTWSKGFQHIYAQHRYKRLFEAILYPEIHSKLEFSVPEEKVLKRILGLPLDESSHYNPIIVLDTTKLFKKHRRPEYLKPEFSGYQRLSYIEGVVDRNDWTALNPYNIQPLHPPITKLNGNETQMERHFFYLKYDSQPNKTKEFYTIDGQNYEMHIKNIPEYKWSRVGRVSDLKDKISEHEKKFRIGVDWLLYETNFEKIGSINSAIFLTPKENSQSVKSGPKISYENSSKYIPKSVS